MLDDMAMRSMRARTQHDYVRHVRAFAAFLGRSPDTATAEDVRRFQVHQREHGTGESVIGGAVSALRFLFTVTLDRPDLSRKLVLAPRPRKLPDVLSVDEVGRLLEATPGIKYRAALGVAYLSRYTHRVAISNSRLLRFDEAGVTFRYKDYRRGGADRQQVMTLTADEFIRRFLLHVLPKGFHRIRHYGLLAGATRKVVLNHVRQLLGVALPVTADVQAEPDDIRPPCPCCGGHMVVVETVERQRQPRAPPALAPPSGTQAS